MIKSCSCATPYEYMERNTKTGEKVYTGHCLNCNGYVKTGGLTMKTAKHTPTPWESFNNYIISPKWGDIANCKIVQEGNPITVEESYANAAHIVHCVNCHDELVANLRELLRRPNNAEVIMVANRCLAKAEDK